MLIPRRVKHRKQHHPKRGGAAKGGTKVNFGEFGIQALTSAYVSNRQIESARIAINRHIKRGGKVWIYKGDVSGSRAERAALEALADRQQRRERAQRPQRRSGSSGTTAGGTEAGRAAVESSTGPVADTAESTVAATSGEVAPETTVAEVAGPEATAAAETTAAETTATETATTDEQGS